MAWPTANDYFDAVQHPLRRFCRPELRRGQAALDDHGKPLVRAGKKIDIYEMRDASGQDRWAIGCFTVEARDLARRYRLINEYLQRHPVPSLVETEYHEQGICIRGRWHPILWSRWVEGMPLNAHVREYLDHPDELRHLADGWIRLARELEQAGIAHGNLASDTVLVSAGQGGSLTLRLVDYDGIYVPSLAESPPEELGHADFQHPQRVFQRPYCADADRFSQLVVLTALYALALEGGWLWDRFDKGDNLLFCHGDYQEPATSALFRELWKSESSTVRALAGQLILACDGSVDDVPSLAAVAECLRPGVAKSFLTGQQIERINSLLEVFIQSRETQDDATAASATNSAGITEDFLLEIEDDPVPTVISEAVPSDAIMEGPPPLPAVVPPLPLAAPPRLPPTAFEHPQMRTFEFDAWMPEEVAVFKLRGFVKDVGGEVVSSIPGYIRVHILDDRDLAEPTAPNLLSWLGLAPQPPAAPRIVAVMELNLVHKPTPTRKLVGITLRLAPGPDDEVSTGWKKFCDRIFCELRGYLMGVA